MARGYATRKSYFKKQTEIGLDGRAVILRGTSQLKRIMVFQFMISVMACKPYTTAALAQAMVTNPSFSLAKAYGKDDLCPLANSV